MIQLVAVLTLGKSQCYNIIQRWHLSLCSMHLTYSSLALNRRHEILTWDSNHIFVGGVWHSLCVNAASFSGHGFLPHWCHNTMFTVCPKKYAHGFVVLCFVVVMQSFIMNSHEVFIHIHQGCFAGTGAIVRLPQCQWSKPDGYGKIGQCITTTKHSNAKTVCIFPGIYCKSLKLLCILGAIRQILF